MSFSCIINVKIPCYISLPHIFTLIFLIYYYFKILHFTCISVTNIILFVLIILFTSYTISTSYTNIHYTVFDVFIVHKQSSFLVIGAPFGLLGVLTVFLFKSSAFSLINSTMVSSVEATDGNSFHFKLIGGFCLVKGFVSCDLSCLFFTWRDHV